MRPIWKGVYFTWNVAEKRDTVSLEVVHRGSWPWLEPVGFPWAKQGPVKAAGASLQYSLEGGPFGRQGVPATPRSAALPGTWMTVWCELGMQRPSYALLV